MTIRRRLDQKILAALSEAFANKRLDVAEHLVRALEVLDGEPDPGSALSDAYLMISRARGDRSRSRRSP